MLTVKIGVFPGSINEFVMEDGITVADALKMANINVGAEQEVKADGEVIDINDEVPSGTKMLLVTKRIKGAC